MATIAFRLTAGAAMRAASTLVGAVVGLLMMPFLVSSLGEHWYGVWTTVGSFVGAYYLLDLGLSSAVTRFVTESLARDRFDAVNRYISTAFALYVGLAVALLAATAIATFAVPYFVEDSADTRTIRYLVFLSGASLAAGFPFKAYAGLVQAKLRYDLLAGWNALLILFLAGLTYVLIRNGSGVLGLAYVSMVGMLLSDAIFVLLSRRAVPEARLSLASVDRTIVGELFGFSIWSFIIQISGLIRVQIDPLVVGWLRGASAVTHYAVGARIAETAVGFLATSTNVVQPVLTTYFAKGETERLKEALILFTKVNASVAFFVVGMLLVLGEPFIRVWMGGGYADSTLIMYALAVAYGLGFIVYPLDNSLYATRKHRFLAITNLVDAAVNLSLSFLLGTYFGAVGVALGTLIPMVVTRYAIVVPYACRQTELTMRTYWRALSRCFVIGVVALLPIVAWVAGQKRELGYGSFTAIIVVSGAVYWPAIIWGGFSQAERAKLSGAFRGGWR
jgi:O-antigen/teichoic acid export membrane protein